MSSLDLIGEKKFKSQSMLLIFFVFRNGRCFCDKCNGRKDSNSTYFRHQKKIKLARNNESIEVLEQDFEPEVKYENDDFFANDNYVNGNYNV